MSTMGSVAVGSDRSITKRSGTLLAASLASVLVAYSAAPIGDFVWDDVTLIVEEPFVQEWEGVGAHFGRAFFGGPAGSPTRSFYRPLITLTFALDWQVWAGSPMGFHLTNLFFHLACVGLVFGVCRRWGATPLAAAIASCAFGLLPRSAEAVAWISGRTDLLAAFFVLLALYVHSPSAARRWGAATVLLLGLLAKEVAVAGLPALLALEVADARKVPPGQGRWIKRLLPLGVSAASYLALRMVATSGVPTFSRATRLGLGDRFVVALEAAGRYAGMIVDPFRSRTQIGSVHVHSMPWVVLGVLVLVTAVAAAWKWRKNLANGGWPGAVAALVVVPIGLVLHLVPLPLKVVAADRFLYVPAAGLAVALAVLAGRSSLRTRKMTAVVSIALLPVAGGATYARTLDWKDELSLWTDAATNAPAGNSLPFVHLGITLSRVDRPEEALIVLERARAADELAAQTGRADPMGSGSREATAFALAALGRFDEAKGILEELRDARPSEPAYRRSLAMVSAMSLDFEGAKREMNHLLARYPDDRDASTYLATLERLAEGWRSLPHGFADEPEVALKRAAIFAELGRRRDAGRIWRKLTEDERVARPLREEAAKRLAAF